MKNILLTTVYIFTIGISVPALAGSNNIDVSEVAEISTEDVKEAHKDIKETLSDTKEDIQRAAEDIYGTLQAELFGDNVKGGTYIVVDYKKTASGMIGQPIYDMERKEIAKVYDLIINNDGEAQRIVLSEGGVLGFGNKLIGLVYDLMVHKDGQGDIIIPITESALKNALPYSYDGDTSMPQNGYSVRDILDGYVIDENDIPLAKIENITFKDGEAGHVIAAIDQSFGVGGKLVAFDFDYAEIKKGVKSVHFKMSPLQEESFKSFKRQLLN